MTEKIEYKGYTIEIEFDSNPEDPRTWDNLGTMVCWHRRAWLGDTTLGERGGRPERDKPFFQTLDELHKVIHQKGTIYLPLYLYEHSGMTMNTTGFGDPWDSGQVGYIYVTKEDIQKEFNCKYVTKKVRNQVLDILKGEVETYDQCLTGEVFGFRIINPEGEEEDSCWGFYGEKDCEQEAKDYVDYSYRQRQAKAWESIPVTADME